MMRDSKDFLFHLWLLGVISVCSGAHKSQFPLQEIHITEIGHDPGQSSALCPHVVWSEPTPKMFWGAQAAICHSKPTHPISTLWFTLTTNRNNRMWLLASSQSPKPARPSPPSTAAPLQGGLCNPSFLLSLTEISLSLLVLIAPPGTWPASSMLLFAHQSFHQNAVIYTVIYTKQHPHGLPRQRTNYQIICEF